MSDHQETTNGISGTEISGGARKTSSPATRPAQRRPDVARVKPPDLPGGGKLLLWLGLGCGTFIVVMSVAAGLGIYGLVSVIKTAELEKLFAGPPPVVPFGEGPEEAFDPENMPEPPLELSEPPAPSTRFEAAELTSVVRSTRLMSVDLATVDEQRLAVWAHQFYDVRSYQAAIKCQYLVVIKTDTGRYNLACFYARAGNIDGALYWLQVGAKEEETDAVWASHDDDLVGVRQDPRWPALFDYMRAYQRYWSVTRGQARSPQDVRGREPRLRRPPTDSR
jgi:hypothetical protein